MRSTCPSLQCMSDAGHPMEGQQVISCKLLFHTDTTAKDSPAGGYCHQKDAYDDGAAFGPLRAADLVQLNHVLLCGGKICPRPYLNKAVTRCRRIRVAKLLCLEGLTAVLLAIAASGDSLQGSG